MKNTGPDVELPFSRKEVMRAGEILRRHRAGEVVGPYTHGAAIATLEKYRTLWQTPDRPVLQGVSMCLRAMLRRFPGAKVSQRLKRVDRIVDKLIRYPKMNLARMDDIGGCRVVFPSLRELHAFEAHFRRMRAEEITGGHDYITNPKSTGYRAVHIIVQRRGLLVEVQLRTRRQQHWAGLVEIIEARSGVRHKDGQGDERERRVQWLVAELFACFDRDEAPPAEITAELARLTEA